MKTFRLRVALTAGLALLAVQFSGLHLHVHQHSSPHEASATEDTHLSLVDVHQDDHAQDQDQDLFDAGPLKSQNPAKNLTLMAMTLVAGLDPFAMASAPPRRAAPRLHTGSPWYLRPPPQAPPL